MHGTVTTRAARAADVTAVTQYDAGDQPLRCGPWARLAWRDGRVVVVYAPELRALVADFYRRYPEPGRLAYTRFLRLSRWVDARYGRGEVASLCCLAVDDAARLFDPAGGAAFPSRVAQAIGGRLTRAVRNAPRECRLSDDLLGWYADPRQSDAADAAAEARAGAARRAADLLGHLDPQARETVELYFGLADGRPWKVSAVGRATGVPHQTVGRRVRAALRAMRRAAGVTA